MFHADRLGGQLFHSRQVGVQWGHPQWIATVGGPMPPVHSIGATHTQSNQQQPDHQRQGPVLLQLLLAASLLALGLVVALPLVLLSSVAGGGAVLVAAATVMSHTGGLGRETFHNGMTVALLVVGAAFLAHCTCRLLPKKRAAAPAGGGRPAASVGPLGLLIRHPLSALWAAVGLLGLPLVLLEWGGNAALPDVLTAVAVLVAFFILLMVLIALPAVITYRCLAGLFRVSRGRPFLSGLVSGAAMVVVVPALGLAWLLVGAPEALKSTDSGAKRSLSAPAPKTAASSSSLPALSRSSLPATPRTSLPGMAASAASKHDFTKDEGLEVTRKVFLAAGELGNQVAELATQPASTPLAGKSCPVLSREALLHQCFQSLGARTEGKSELNNVAAFVKKQFRLSESDAMDATMNALVSVCERHAKSPFDRLGAALMTAARRKAIDLYKKRRGEFPQAPDQLERNCLLWPTDELRLRSEVRVVQRALDALDPVSRKAIVLWATGHTRREIAQDLEVPFQRACDLVNNSIKKLRRLVRHRCQRSL